MRTRKNRSCIAPILIGLFFILGAAIIWVGIPVMTEKAFGAPSPALTSYQVRQYGLKLLLSKGSLEKPASSADVIIPFEIPLGRSITNIAADLENAGLIYSAPSFRNYLIYKGYDSSIRAGEYSISTADSPFEIAELLRSDNPVITFYLYPGWRAEEVAEGLVASGVQITTSEFMRIVNNPGGNKQTETLQNPVSLEGYLFPGEYVIRKDSTAEELILGFTQRFEAEVLPVINQAGDRSGLSVSEIITLASIIQRETLVESEMGKIASVFYNRLEAGMKLETDPTVQYALGYDQISASWWKTSLSYSDLQVASQFNTYATYGLSPHAISNPGLAAIQAALHPETTNYYYFQANCDGSGSHVFSETYEEHLSHNCN